MHDQNEKEHSSMMWMMVICCALPLVFLLFGGRVLSAGGYLPQILIAAVAITCIWMMFKGHGGHDGA